MLPDIPTDLSALDNDSLSALLDKIHAAARELAAAAPTEETIAGLTTCRDGAAAVRAELDGRAERAAAAAALLDQTAASATIPATEATDTDDGDGEGTAADAGESAEDDDGDDGDDGDEPAVTAPAVTAARRSSRRVPRVADAAARRPSNTSSGVPSGRSRTSVMAAAADVPGFASGATLETFDDAARALAARMDQYPAAGVSRLAGMRGRPALEAVDERGRVFAMTKYARHGAVQIRREFPPELRANETNGRAVSAFAAKESRLPGGSLLESTRRAHKAGKALTAAAGWCAESETVYDLAGGELESLEGILDIAEIQTSRGGWNIPANGGPAFSAIWNGIGNSGTTHLSEAEVVAGATKYCYDIPCPDFTDVRLGVDYMCLTGGLLQRRGYPELVARYARGAMVALAHKINQGVVAAIQTAAGAATVLPADPSGDDAIASLLAGVDLAIVDIKYATRMGLGATLEVVLPMWVLAQMRAAGSRRNGVDMVSTTDAQIVEWFAERNAVPRFVYDWQDSFAGLVTGPGGATALTALPLTCDFLVYPAGTFVKASQDVVNLDTIYDSTNLATNEYTAVFVEDGWAVLQMGPVARRYTVPVDPSGVVACCAT